MSSLGIKAQQYHFKSAFDYADYYEAYCDLDLKKARIHAEAGLLAYKTECDESYHEFCKLHNITPFGNYIDEYRKDGKFLRGKKRREEREKANKNIPPITL